MPIWEADACSEEVFSGRMALAVTTVYPGWLFKLSLFWEIKNHRSVSVVGEQEHVQPNTVDLAPAVLLVWRCYFFLLCVVLAGFPVPLIPHPCSVSPCIRRRVGISPVSNDTHPRPLKGAVKNVLGLWVQSGCREEPGMGAREACLSPTCALNASASAACTCPRSFWSFVPRRHPDSLWLAGFAGKAEITSQGLCAPPPCPSSPLTLAEEYSPSMYLPCINFS